MAKKLLLASIVNEEGQLCTLKTEEIFDKTTRQSVAEFIGRMEKFKTGMETFLTGEDDNNGALDRLSELVAAINANQNSIKEIIDGAFTNAHILRLLDAADGKLTFNGKPVGIGDGTGIAFGTSAETATDFTGKIKIILEEFEYPCACDALPGECDCANETTGEAVHP